MSDSTPLHLFALVIGGYFAFLWWSDYRDVRHGKADPARVLPGATSARLVPCLLAALGALLILAGETWGEIALGISEEQSKVTVLFGFYTLIAAVIEEIIFRGYLVVTQRGPLVKWLAVLGASLLFAAIHPFLWKFESGASLLAYQDWTWTWQFTVKGWFSTAVVFLSSLWFYTVRFWSLNPTASLLPCFAAHFAKNLGVFAVKGYQGHIEGLW